MTLEKEGIYTIPILLAIICHWLEVPHWYQLSLYSVDDLISLCNEFTKGMIAVSVNHLWSMANNCLWHCNCKNDLLLLMVKFCLRNMCPMNTHAKYKINLQTINDTYAIIDTHGRKAKRKLKTPSQLERHAGQNPK